MKNLDFIDGLLYAIQYLVLDADDGEAENLVKESGYKYEDFIKAQKKTGYNNRKMNKFFKEVLTPTRKLKIR